MGQVIDLPVPAKTLRYADRLQTNGEPWTGREKKILDQAEFLEAMILVLDDVKLQNIQNRDYSMMEIITEEITRYQGRLDEARKALFQLRNEYLHSGQRLAN